MHNTAPPPPSQYPIAAAPPPPPSIPAPLSPLSPSRIPSWTEVRVLECPVIVLELETRVDELEQYTRQDDLVISGLKTRHKSYARATVSEQLQDSQNAPYEEMESLEDHVTRFVEDKMGVRLLSTDVSICHTLPGKKDIPNIVLRLTNRKAKNKILKEARQLKGTNVYINEHLTKKNMTIAATARRLRKEKKILNTWSRNCKIFVKINQNGQLTTRVITEMQDFEKLNLT